jgi:hypothetical protein
MKRILWGLLLGSLFPMVISCGDKSVGTGTSTESLGQLKMAVVTSETTHNVGAIYIGIMDQGSSCSGLEWINTPGKGEALKPEPLTGSLLELALPLGSMHPFGDAFFVLPPKSYWVCAWPLTWDDSTESWQLASCCKAVFDKDVKVLPNSTVETRLILQCSCGNPNGGLDVVTVLNDPPLITDLLIKPNKFTTNCASDSVTLTVTASDPNGDPLSYVWKFSEQPQQSNNATVQPDSIDPSIAVFKTDTAGDYKIQVIVSDGTDPDWIYGVTWLEFPIHVRECCDPTCDLGQICCAGICKTGTACEGCGDGVVQANEQCEPPNTETCDANCQTIVPSPA